MSRDKVTSLDVARLAGVSQSAVSRVFTPGASASKATRERVMEAAATLGYRPNTLARAMITGRSRIVGLVVADLNNQFYSVALELLSRALQDKGYQVLVFLSGNATESVAPMLQSLTAKASRVLKRVGLGAVLVNGALGPNSYPRGSRRLEESARQMRAST